MNKNIIENKFKTIEEGIDILKLKWSLYFNSGGGFMGASLYYDCESLAAELIKNGAKKEDIIEAFPPYDDIR